jgi:hypothetical protein
VNHRLCMSRSIGDLELKSLGVTAVPDIKQVPFIWGSCTELWIRIPDPDMDPDPAFQMNPDPGF